MKTDGNIYGIFGRLVSGEITEEDRTILREWVGESADNELELQDLYRVISRLKTLDAMQEIDIEAALEKVRKKTGHRTFLRKVAGYWRTIAAVLVLPIATLAAIQSLRSSSVANVRTSSMFGQISEIVLSDSSVVKLNSGSILEYPSSFGHGERKVKLEGEAYFSVSADNDNPFIVECNNIEVTAVGTEFNVSGKESGDVITSVMKGRVNMVNPDNGNTMIAEINPGQTMFYRKGGVSLLTSPDFEQSERYTAWTRGKMIFKNDSLDTVLSELKRYYNVDFVFDDTVRKDYFYTGTFDRIDFENIIKYIEYTTPVDVAYEREENGMRIYRISAGMAN